MNDDNTRLIIANKRPVPRDCHTKIKLAKVDNLSS